MEHPTEEGHPIDNAVARRVRHVAQRKQLLHLQDRVLARLGEERKPFLEFEELRGCVSAEREEAYFNLGYEHGLADERARDRRGTEKTLALATEIRERVVQAQLPPQQAALGLLECLWAVVADADERLRAREAKADVTRARARRSRRP
jgi:hypothetical protein